MKLYLVICLLLITSCGLADDCTTYCTCVDVIVTCHSPPTFPKFLIPGIIQTLIIIDSDMATLELTREKFTRLTTLVLRNCHLISCEDMLDINVKWPELVIQSDLICSTSEIVTDGTTYGMTVSTLDARQVLSKTDHNNDYTWVASVAAIGTVLLVFIAIVSAVYCYKKYRNRVRPIFTLDNINYRRNNSIYADTTI